MPIIKSAIKRAKQTVKRRERNVATKREIKDAVKAFMAKPSATLLSKAQSEIDTAVKKNLISKNTAARRKANLSKFAKNAGVKLGAAKKATTTPAKAKAAPKTAAKVVAKPAAKAAAKPVAKKAPAKKPAAKK
ncbi:MAG: 30S ribosomal protein S20 [Candidatus Microsaccharimonas sp.]